MQRSGVLLRSHVVTLGLAEGKQYTQAELKQAFHRQAKLYHPDAGGDSDRFREVRNAYEALSHSKPSSASPSYTPTDSSEVKDRAQYSRWSWNVYRSNGSAEGTQWRKAYHHPQEHAEYDRMRYDSSTHSSNGGNSSSFSSRNGRTGSTPFNADEYPNYSTWHFYRPYASSPFGHGFTEEEVRRATVRNRFYMARVILKHVLLWTGVVYLVYCYRRNDRIRRAAAQRDGGYGDPTYWELLKQEEAEWGSRYSTRQSMEEWTEKIAKEKEELLKNHPLAPRADQFSGRLVAISYKGRPFTPNGVLGEKSTAPKTEETFFNDMNYEPEECYGADEDC